MSSEQELTQEETDALGRKANRVIALGFFVIAAIIISVNMLCRFAGINKAKQYEYTDGVVTRTEEKKSYPFGGYGRPSYDYTIWVEYQPEDEDYAFTLIDSSYTYEYIDKGDALRVYYRKDNPDEAYAAKKDWLTRKYLPVENNYNIAVIIAEVLIIIGLFFFIGDIWKKAK